MDGGPELMYDHQMVIDSTQQMLYIFGGRTVGPDPTQNIYSGLYSYNIESSKWTLLRSDTPIEGVVCMKSRIGHSMLINTSTNQLYIFAGQRHKDYLSDFYTYDINTDTFKEEFRDYSVMDGPNAGFTQRATLDLNRNEIYILSGLQREKNTSTEAVKNSFWVFNLITKKWTRVYHNENVGLEYWDEMGDKEPCPRFAHQLVYDSRTGSQFLFGGNPGDTQSPNLRLDDFWELVLERPKPHDVLRRVQFLVRKRYFMELCATGGNSLEYLQTNVYDCVDHENEAESKEFQGLGWYLFGWGDHSNASANQNAFVIPEGDNNVGGGGLLGSTVSRGFFLFNSEVTSARYELFESLLEYFPVAMKQPNTNMVDLIPFV